MSDLARPLIIVHSSSFVLRRRELQRLLGQLLPDGSDEYGLEQFWSGADSLQEMAAAIPAVSLLADARVVVLHELQLVRVLDQKPLVRPLQNIPPGTTVIITTAPKDPRDRKPPLSADIMKLVKQQGEVRELAAPAERNIGGWITQEVGGYGKRIAGEALRLLVDTCGTDVDRLANEIAKLAVYVGEAPEITGADVEAAVSGMDDRGIFDLVDAIGRRDAPTAMDILRALLPPSARRGEGIGILGMIGRHIRLLWQAVYTLKTRRNLGDIPDEIKAAFPKDPALDSQHSFVKEKLTGQARNFTEAQLARALVRVYETDLLLKGFGDQQTDDRTALELLVVSLCR